MKQNIRTPKIRLSRVTLKDFRNIEECTVEMPNGKIENLINEEPSVLGLYGQNGSGKSSLMLAVTALKYAMSGDEFLYPVFESCIRKGCESAGLRFVFAGYNGEDRFEIEYGFTLGFVRGERETGDFGSLYKGLGSVYNEDTQARIMAIMRPKDRRLQLTDETLHISYHLGDGEKSARQAVIDTSAVACSSKRPFGNAAKYKAMTAKLDPELRDSLAGWKIEAAMGSRSFIFSHKVLKALTAGCENEAYASVLKALRAYAGNLSIIGMGEAGYNNIKVLPLSLWDGEGDSFFCFSVPLNLLEHCSVPEKIYPIVTKCLPKINRVINAIIPELTVGLIDIGKTITDRGEIHLFDLTSKRGDAEIPLAYESDGIRRIVSFICVLIAVYNNPSATVVIDEIDSGIFEYMLGEMVAIMGESAKGQMIFTCHNLRPLEVLPEKYLLFTSVNPRNRFVKLESAEGDENLRDNYFRSIILGTGKDAVYRSTDTFMIEQALYEAWQPEV